jgi:hypothetical protein
VSCSSCSTGPTSIVVSTVSYRIAHATRNKDSSLSGIREAACDCALGRNATGRLEPENPATRNAQPRMKAIQPLAPDASPARREVSLPNTR